MYSIYAKVRDEKGLNDYNVSKACGISAATLSDWKKGKYTPKSDKMQKIADFLGVSVTYLTTGKDTPKDSTEGKTYYFTDETAEAAQEMFDDPDLHALMNAARGCPAEVIRSTTELLKRFKETNPDG